MKKIMAPVLSFFLPGAGHICLGMAKKGMSLLVIDMVLAVTFFSSQALMIKALMILVFTAVMLPAVVETWMLAHSGQAAAFSDSKRYIIFMILTTGFGALPLLWQSSFSKKNKILWTLAVPLLAAVFFTGLYLFREPIEQSLQKWII